MKSLINYVITFVVILSIVGVFYFIVVLICKILAQYHVIILGVPWQ